MKAAAARVFSQTRTARHTATAEEAAEGMVGMGGLVVGGYFVKRLLWTAPGGAQHASHRANQTHLYGPLTRFVVPARPVTWPTRVYTMFVSMWDASADQQAEWQGLVWPWQWCA